MKKTLMILFTVAIASVSLNAQEAKQPPPKKTPEQRAEMMTARMTKSLELNADQQKKIKEFILKREQDREVMEGKIKANREEMEKKTDEEFKKILNSEQFQKFEKKKEEMKKKREEKHNSEADDDGMPPPPPAPEK